MPTLLNALYYKLRKEEIDKARNRFMRIKIETILQSLTKLCWKYNIQYEVIIKTSDMLTMKLYGSRETVLFKYHKTDMVLRDEIDFFMSELDENRADKGVYLTTGIFKEYLSFKGNRVNRKKDCLLEDNFTFIKRHLGLKGKAAVGFKAEKLNFFKYLPE